MNQFVTHWRSSGVNGFGKPAYELPRYGFARWEGNRKQYTDEKGVAKVSNAIIYTYENLYQVGDYVCLGIAEDPNPLACDGAYAIDSVERTYNIRATQILVKLCL
jgi:hypothetical protein